MWIAALIAPVPYILWGGISSDFGWGIYTGEAAVLLLLHWNKAVDGRYV